MLELLSWGGGKLPARCKRGLRFAPRLLLETRVLFRGVKWLGDCLRCIRAYFLQYGFVYLFIRERYVL